MKRTLLSTSIIVFLTTTITYATYCPNAPLVTYNTKTGQYVAPNGWTTTSQSPIQKSEIKSFLGASLGQTKTKNAYFAQCNYQLGLPSLLSITLINKQYNNVYQSGPNWFIPKPLPGDQPSDPSCVTLSNQTSDCEFKRKK